MSPVKFPSRRSMKSPPAPARDHFLWLPRSAAARSLDPGQRSEKQRRGYQGRARGHRPLGEQEGFSPARTNAPFARLRSSERTRTGVPPSGGGSAVVPPSPADFISEIDGIKSQAPGATVDYIAACVPDPATAEWQTETGSAGLVGQYFNTPDLSGSPVATRVDSHLNFAGFNASNVPDPSIDPANFSGIWTGKVTPTISGDHVFKVSSGGNVRLFVNSMKLHP